ncbi:MAG: TIGR01777 family oxidoreductase [Verrucomicrobiota bacterium]
MAQEYFEKFTQIEASAGDLFDWHTRPCALNRLTPPWENVKTVEALPALRNGARTTMEVRTGPIKQRWTAELQNVEEGKQFVDVQVNGPFAEWLHRHRFVRKGKSTSVLLDEITYRLPLGFVGQFLGGRFVKKRLERTFRYRHRVTADDVARLKEPLFSEVSKKRILVSGGKGLVGDSLSPLLKSFGHTVLTLTRNPTSENDVGWDLENGTIDLAAAGQIDALIHLAGENIAGGRWTKKRMDRIFYSRKNGTRLLADTIARMENPPQVVVSASGTNYYQSTPLNVHNEESPIGTSFLSEVCREWEGQWWPAEEAGIRVTKLRIGAVLSPAGGMLGKLLPLFLAGGGGPVGDGKQRLSWIAIDDLVDILHRAVLDKRFEGPVNVTTPHWVTNADFGKTLGRVVRRPSFLPAPAFALRAAFGQLADEALLADVAVEPAKLKEFEYPFRFPKLEEALCHLLGRRSPKKK